MALTNLPTAPTVSGVYGVRDTVPQLNYMSENSAKAFRNAFDTAMDFQNEIVKSKQKDLIDKENDRQENLDENIRNDQILLAKMEKELADLKAGKDVELRSGVEKLQQNNVPEMQKKLDMLNSIDNNSMKWNWANVANLGGDNG